MTTPTRPTAPHSRRGSILLVVAAMVILATLIAVTAGTTIRADLRLHAAANDATTHNDAAMDALRVVLAELNDQSLDILLGDTPTTEQPFDLYETQSAVVTAAILPLSQQDGTGRLHTPESARINLNTATRELLEATEALDDATIDAVLQARARGPLTSLAVLHRDQQANDQQPSPDIQDPLSDDMRPEDLFTVWSFDPETVGRLNAQGQEPGDPRINLDATPPDQAAERIADAAGPRAASLLTALLDSDTQPRSRAQLMPALRNAGLDAVTIGTVIDAVTFSDAPHAEGRIDINRASATVLAAIFGIEDSDAESLVTARDTLDSEAATRITWPIELGILSPQQLEPVADRLTTRTTQWSVRVAIRIEEDTALNAEPDAPPSAEGFAFPSAEQTRYLAILDAVIDTSTDTPRVLAITDATATLYAQSLALASAITSTQPPSSFEEDQNPDRFEDPDTAASADANTQPPQQQRTTPTMPTASTSQSPPAARGIEALARWATPGRGPNQP